MLNYIYKYNKSFFLYIFAERTIGLTKFENI